MEPTLKPARVSLLLCDLNKRESKALVSALVVSRSIQRGLDFVPMKPSILVAVSIVGASRRLLRNASDNCITNPSICLLNETCWWDIQSLLTPATKGWCKPNAMNQTDCYRNPGMCASDEWCEVQDHTSWAEIDHGTRGECVSYQVINTRD
jgi:hypothetical protein